jgi:pSer/pThr/pTyr-binding forkhead associated (FHA) protein
LSRRHAKVLVEGDQISVREEVGTANGTYVNDARLQTGAPVRLSPGDKVRFGSVEVVVESV